MQSCWLVCAALLIVTAGAVLSDQAPQVNPELRVSKPGFAKGEDLEFTLGLKGLTSAQVHGLNKAGLVGQVIITSPSGKTTVRQVDMGYGGLTQNYILGHNSLRRESLEIGRYTLQYRVGAQRTPPVVVMVADLPVLSKVHAALRLEAVPGFPESLANSHVILTVRNDTNQIVRFPRSTGMEGLIFSVRGLSGDWENRTFDTSWSAPQQPKTLFNTYEFTWDAAEALPTVTLRPGEKFEQKISLKPACDSYLDTYKKDLPVPPGRFEVTLTQSLNVLIGDRHDAQSAFFPVRLPLKVAAEFTSGSAP